ncbi:MAG TPA: dual specificity protein phosphatase family protein [Thermoguttaceae bacterium]|nr:dual specificity protein phosphatase family protein [Thermoguttaceae bacterium]
MPRPRAGDWLADELASWKSAGVDVVVSLLTDDEISELDLKQEPALCEAIDLTFLSYPIADRDVPSSIDGFLVLVDRLHDYLQNDRGVAVHCRMGIGRSSLVAACLLVKAGLKPRDAFRSISRDRGIDVPDTKDQIEWVESVADQLQMGRPQQNKRMKPSGNGGRASN